MTPTYSEIEELDNSFRGMTQNSGDDVMNLGKTGGTSIIKISQFYEFQMTEELIEIIIDGIVPFMFSPIISEDGHPILTIEMFILSVLNRHTNSMLYNPNDFEEIKYYL
jgi:hypothetical protein